VRTKVVRGNEDTAPAWIVSISPAECDKLPLLPWAEIVKFPVCALAAAVKSTVALLPAATENGLAGLEVTPTGKPDSVTCTLPLKPSFASTETVSPELVAPRATVTVFEERGREKSASCWVEGGGTVEEPPPHPMPDHAASSKIGTLLLNRPTVLPLGRFRS